MSVTIATHNGSEVAYEHNIRNRKVTDKEGHIRRDGIHEIWHDEKVRDAYHRLFDDFVRRYNEKQSREERKIRNYYDEICKDAKKHPVYEMIIGVYPQNGDPVSKSARRAILKRFVENWQERNPNMVMIGAYFHDDEEGGLHCHIDYIPIGHGFKKGMEVQTSLNRALQEQGFQTKGNLTAQIQWEKSENAYLESLCNERGLVVEHPAEEGRKHLETEVYKVKKANKVLQQQNEELVEAIEAGQEVIEYQKKEIEELTEVVLQHQQENIGLVTENAAVKRENSQIRKENEELRKVMKEIIAPYIHVYMRAIELANRIRNRVKQSRAFERVNRVFGKHNVDLERAIEKVEDRIMPSEEEQESLIEGRRCVRRLFPFHRFYEVKKSFFFLM